MTASLRARFAILAIGLAAGSTLLRASPSCAETWIPTSRSEYGTAFSYDADSLKREGANVTAWVLSVSRYGGSERALSRYNCSRKTVTLLSSTTYRANGSVENRFVLSPSQQSELSVIAGTYAEKILKAVCARK